MTRAEEIFNELMRQVREASEEAVRRTGDNSLLSEESIANAMAHATLGFFSNAADGEVQALAKMVHNFSIAAVAQSDVDLESVRGIDPYVDDTLDRIQHLRDRARLHSQILPAESHDDA